MNADTLPITAATEARAVRDFSYLKCIVLLLPATAVCFTAATCTKLYKWYGRATVSSATDSSTGGSIGDTCGADREKKRKKGHLLAEGVASFFHAVPLKGLGFDAPPIFHAESASTPCSKVFYLLCHQQGQQIRTIGTAPACRLYTQRG